MFTTKQSYEVLGRVVRRTDADTPDAMALIDLADRMREYAHLSEQLEHAAVTILRDMDDVLRKLEEDYHVNSLGEIQARGPQLDILCARRTDAAQAVRRTAYHYAKLGVVMEEQIDKLFADTPFEHGNITASGR